MNLLHIKEIIKRTPFPIQKSSICAASNISCTACYTMCTALKVFSIFKLINYILFFIFIYNLKNLVPSLIKALYCLKPHIPCIIYRDHFNFLIAIATIECIGEIYTHVSLRLTYTCI